MSFGKRLKAIIKEERYTLKEFSNEVDIPISTLERYVYEKSEAPNSALTKIATHSKFKKYTVWLLTGDVDPNSGQVSPDFSTQEQCGLTVADEDDQKKA